MRVVFVSHDAGVYGAPRSLLNLIDGLSSKGIECYVIVPYKGPLVQEIQKRNIEFTVIPYAIWVHKKSSIDLLTRLKIFIKHFPGPKISRAFKNILAIPKIKAQIQSWNADIVYTNSSVTPVGAIAAYLAKKPHVWHIREFLNLDQGLVLDWNKLLFKKVVNLSREVVFISEALKDYYKNTLGVNKGTIVYNGIATTQDFNNLKLQKAALQSQEKEYYTFCILGRIDPQKGQKEAIKATAILLQRSWKIKLIIAGSGDQLELANLSKELKINHSVDIVGWTDDSYSIYNKSDACLVCSSSEGFGRVTIEAMAAALPVIGKNHVHAATKELIKHNQTGLLYSGNELELANTMEILLKEPKHGTFLGMKGWQIAKKDFNREKYVNNITKIIREITRC